MKEKRLIPLSRLLVPLGTVLVFMVLYDFLLPHLHRWVEPHVPNRGLRLLLVDYPKVFIQLLAVVWFCTRLERTRWRAILQRIGFTSLKFRPLAVGILACLLGFGYVFFHAHLANARWELRPRLIYFLPFLLVLTCFGEELVYRGFFFRLLRKGRSFFMATLISGVLVVLDHYYQLGIVLKTGGVDGWKTVVIDIAGKFLWVFALNFLYERGGNAIWACMLAHLGADTNMLFNLFMKTGMPMNWWSYNGGTVRTFVLPLLFLFLFAILLPRNKRLSKL